uniref:sulfate ABC transporter substrate-binding protein n=1 Tax=Pseudoxanthobacter sp. TaxID=1925742 RepID=UPI002FE116BB
ATTTFVERETGDVLITFEAETRGIAREYGTDKFETVVPPVSLLAEFPVSVVDKVVDKRGSRAIATNYLDYLYSPEGQEILATFGNRVRDKAVVEKHRAEFPDVRLVTVEEVFGGWDKARTQFASGGLVDELLTDR